jgi:excisionase family DNA binding protein
MSYQRHRMTYSAEYRAWKHAKERCFNPNARGYARYGGRGITMCPEWVHDFTAFFAHIGPRPAKGLLLDRIDNDRHYEVGNVRWATPLVSGRNHGYPPTHARLPRPSGTIGVSEAAVLCSVTRRTIRNWIDQGLLSVVAQKVGNLTLLDRRAVERRRHQYWQHPNPNHLEIPAPEA